MGDDDEWEGDSSGAEEKYQALLDMAMHNGFEEERTAKVARTELDTIFDLVRKDDLRGDVRDPFLVERAEQLISILNVSEDTSKVTAELDDYKNRGQKQQQQREDFDNGQWNF